MFFEEAIDIAGKPHCIFLNAVTNLSGAPALLSGHLMTLVVVFRISQVLKEEGRKFRKWLWFCARERMQC